MDQREYRWHITLIKQRYQSFNLTFQQAERIYNYEQTKNTYSDENFADWEEWDYEKTEFRKILNKNQFKVYEKWLSQMIKRYEENLIELDKKRLKRLRIVKKSWIIMKRNFCSTFLRTHFSYPQY